MKHPSVELNIHFYKFEDISKSTGTRFTGQVPAKAGQKHYHIKPASINWHSCLLVSCKKGVLVLPTLAVAALLHFPLQDACKKSRPGEDFLYALSILSLKNISNMNKHTDWQHLLLFDVV